MPGVLPLKQRQYNENIWQRNDATLLVVMTHYREAAEKAAGRRRAARLEFSSPRGQFRGAHGYQAAIDIETPAAHYGFARQFPEHALLAKRVWWATRRANINGGPILSMATVIFFITPTLFAFPSPCALRPKLRRRHLRSGRDRDVERAKGEKPTLNGEEFAVSDRADLAKRLFQFAFLNRRDHRSGSAAFCRDGSPARANAPPGKRRSRYGYVACGRFDAYIEQGISLWTLPPDGILVETAGHR